MTASRKEVDLIIETGPAAAGATTVIDASPVEARCWCAKGRAVSPFGL